MDVFHLQRPALSIRPRCTAKPNGSPVSLAELKRHCHVDHTDDDAILQVFLDAAVEKLDGLSGRLGRCMLNQTWLFACHCWRPNGIRIPLPDVSQVTISYQDGSDQTQSLSNTMFRPIEVTSGTLIEWTASFTAPSLYQRSDAVSISVVAGYGDDPLQVPAPLRTAIQILAGTWYQNREAYTADGGIELPFAVNQLIAGYRRNTV